MRVVSNTAIALDGRIATVNRDHFALGTRLDRAYMSVLRSRADAVLVGGMTFRNWPLPLVPSAEDLDRLRREDFFDSAAPSIEGRRWKNVIVTRTLDLPAAPRFWSDPRVEPLVYSPREGTVPGLVVGKTDPAQIVADLERRGVQTCLLECGGDLLAQWLAAGVVHEVYVTVCPLLLGGVGAPSLMDGVGFGYQDAPRLRLVHAVPVGSEIYCRYEVLN